MNFSARRSVMDVVRITATWSVNWLAVLVVRYVLRLFIGLTSALDFKSPGTYRQLQVPSHMTFVVRRVALGRASPEHFLFHFSIYINLG